MRRHKDSKDSYIKPSIWRWLLAFWTLLAFTLIIVDFASDNVINQGLVPVLIIYAAVLSAYSAEKEFRRWHEFHVGRHPGEIYVILWTILLFIIFVTDLVSQMPYKMPDSVISTYIIVLGILAITRNSKRIFSEKDKE